MLSSGVVRRSYDKVIYCIKLYAPSQDETVFFWWAEHKAQTL